MVKNIVRSAVLAAALLATTSQVSFAQETREGSVRAKVAVQGVFPTGKTTIQGSKLKHKNNVGAELSSSYFVTDNVATELAVGFNEVRYKNANGGNSKAVKYKSVPVTLTFQYHTPQVGAFSPYVGAGYFYAFNSSKKSTKSVVKFKNSTGPVLQLGANFESPVEGLGLNLDVKQLWEKPKARLTSYAYDATHTTSGRYKFKANPTVVSLGATYRF